MAYKDEPKRLKVRQKAMAAVDNLVTAEDDRRRGRLLERAMECQALQIVCMGDARKHDVGDPRVDEVEVGEIFDGNRLESRIPGMVSFEVGSEHEVSQGVLVLVQHRPHLAHVCEAIVVLGTQCEFPQVTERRHTDSVKVPTTEKTSLAISKFAICDIYMSPKPRMRGWLLRTAWTISARISG